MTVYEVYDARKEKEGNDARIIHPVQNMYELGWYDSLSQPKHISVWTAVIGWNAPVSMLRTSEEYFSTVLQSQK